MLTNLDKMTSFYKIRDQIDKNESYVLIWQLR